MEDTMNWWLIIFLGMVVLNQGAQFGAAKDRHEFWGIVTGVPLYWGLLYMAGVFTLL